MKLSRLTLFITACACTTGLVALLKFPAENPSGKPEGKPSITQSLETQSFHSPQDTPQRSVSPNEVKRPDVDLDLSYEQHFTGLVNALTAEEREEIENWGGQDIFTDVDSSYEEYSQKTLTELSRRGDFAATIILIDKLRTRPITEERLQAALDLAWNLAAKGDIQSISAVGDIYHLLATLVSQKDHALSQEFRHNAMSIDRVERRRGYYFTPAAAEKYWQGMDNDELSPKAIEYEARAIEIYDELSATRKKMGLPPFINTTPEAYKKLIDEAEAFYAAKQTFHSNGKSKP